MPNKKWTSTSAMAEFLRREQDILKRHRMPTDRDTTINEVLEDIIAPGNNGNGGGEQLPVTYGEEMQ